MCYKCVSTVTAVTLETVTGREGVGTVVLCDGAVWAALAACSLLSCRNSIRACGVVNEAALDAVSTWTA